MAKQNNTILSLKDVSFSVDGTNILKDISLDIESNCFTVLLGPSGSGKSTVLRLLNSLNSPTGGRLLFHGNDVNNIEPTDLRKKVGMVFQSPVMVMGSVKDNLTLTQKWDKNSTDFPDDELNETLAQVGLNSDFLKKDAKSLSGGEQQRIALARVLLNKPEVLLLDEPTSSLDPALAVKILNLICEVSKKLELTVVLVTHHHREVEKYAKKVVVLIDGIIAESGGSEIITAPQTPAVKTFMAKEEK